MSHTDVKPNIRREVEPEVVKEEVNIGKEPKELKNKDNVGVKKLPPREKDKLKVTFSQEELKKALEPFLMRIQNQSSEAEPFLSPVDPELLNLPDYFDIIKNPMDLSTIKKKLDDGSYSDPWQFVDDVRLMFENAWTYNKKRSKEHKCAIKVMKI